MRKLALLAVASLCALAVPAAPALAYDESPEAQLIAGDAAADARAHMADLFGVTSIAPGKYLWSKKDSPSLGTPRVVISLSDQLAFVYRGNQLVAASSISSGKPGKDTPVGIFPILAKKPMHHSKKYENAPMPFMQRIDDYGIALHAGFNPGRPASHGCVRLPAGFAKKLYSVTDLGTTVVIAA